MKKLTVILFIAVVLTCITKNLPAQISSIFYGQNYWMPAYGGNWNGHMEDYWRQIRASGVKYMRIGG
jgi:hypothetical protein